MLSAAFSRDLIEEVIGATGKREKRSRLLRAEHGDSLLAGGMIPGGLGMAQRGVALKAVPVGQELAVAACRSAGAGHYLVLVAGPVLSAGGYERMLLPAAESVFYQSAFIGITCNPASKTHR